MRHLNKQSQIHGKLLYGSDFPVPYSTIYNTYDLKFSKRVELFKEKNAFDRGVRAVMEYFPENSEIWGNYKKILDL